MKLYQRVKIVNDNYIDCGICNGAIGYILNIYDDEYCEVEFSDSEGITYALQAICVNDIIVFEE